MQITLERAVDGFIGYLADQVATIPHGVERWLAFGALASLKKNPAIITKNARQYLEMAGVVEDGMVDLDAVKEFLEGAFSSEPKISYFNFTFTKEDVPALLAKMDVKEAI